LKTAFHLAVQTGGTGRKSKEFRLARVLVTGGAGFIGSHLCDHLLGEGFDVIAMDNLITGNIRNIEHLAGNEHFTFIKQDVTEYIYVAGKIDYIFHFVIIM
jgi:dTDP-glucose 4,6-dehydratase